MTYSQKLKDPRWQRKRLEIFERDNFTCRDCGSKENTLHVHHCAYAKDPWDVEDQFLLTICEACHEHRQTIEDEAKRALAKFFCRLSKLELEKFTTDLIVGAGDGVSLESPRVVCAEQSVWDSDIRWFHYACDHPEARPVYNAVIGISMDWHDE